MDFQVFPNAEQLSVAAARWLTLRIQTNPSLLLCLATGNSPTQTYRHLIESHTTEPGFFSQARIIKLDEWGGIPMDHAGTCETYLQRHFIQPAHVDPALYCSFRSDAPDPEMECSRIRQYLVDQGPIDVCVLGIGVNGHLALNEPGTEIYPGPHVTALAESTQQHPMIGASEQKPAFGYTLGLGDILQSREILLLISGASKKAVLKHLQQPSISTEFPASFLWLHPSVAVFADKEAIGF